MYYIIKGTYNPQPLFEEFWKVDNFEELVTECDYILDHNWTITDIILVTEAE